MPSRRTRPRSGIPIGHLASLQTHAASAGVRSDHVERMINIFGQGVSLVDRDGSHYLSGLAQDFEIDTQSAFAAICAPHFNVLDIGANIGLTTIALGRLCSEGKVFAIEASPDTTKYLKQNIVRAGLRNVCCENMAASSTDGQLSLSTVANFSAGSFINRKYQPHGDGYLHYTVRARPIDEYLKTLGVDRIDLIKIDVEGFELEVLRGARQTIEKCRPIIYCEVNHWCLNVFQRLSLPDFIEQVYEFCPHVFAIDSDLQYLELRDPTSLHTFYHAHVTRFGFMNLLCGFDRSAMLAKLGSLSQSYRFEVERSALRLQRDALLNSRSWRYAAPLRRAWALRKYLRRAA